ncbi:PIG-L deacetylase family protein [Chelativorans sp. YIM 93263]|uniref:PIG-L deacetylase family protein n=1 Tax=Chelativorans sp. YIM 93263 TaxID=2906648 RepID=UPI0023780A58|nr:PIG-L deacetylase family protein [Chelativorans sp. YIM 93263]
MNGFSLLQEKNELNVLCIGAHSDDIEIGLGGTILSLADGRRLNVHWCVCSARGLRSDEAHASATGFLAGANDCRIELGSFDDSYFPAQSRAIKDWLAVIKTRSAPDLVFTHAADDAHQDHRQVNEITWNLFRDHLVLEYEIPKWDGDIAPRNLYVPLTKSILDRKTELLMAHFGSQRSKDWFDTETFKALARLRGMECRAPEHFAEAFTLKKGSLLLRPAAQEHGPEVQRYAELAS